MRRYSSAKNGELIMFRNVRDSMSSLHYLYFLETTACKTFMLVKTSKFREYVTARLIFRYLCL
jgi:hypothetical protein